MDGNRIPVAIKHVAMDRRAAELFEKYEMRGIESLTGRNHSSLVKFIGYFKGEDGDGRIRMNFVFERCPTAVPYLLDAITTGKGFVVPSDDFSSADDRVGCDLLSNPLRVPPMDILEAKFIIRQVLEALQYLHGSTPSILHRDVKPGNILIWGSTSKTIENNNNSSSSNNNSSSTNKTLIYMDIKLTDYGTVRRMDTRDLTVGQGTKSFMAPEVDVQTGTKNAKPTGTYDTSVDIFSVGATFFYLVTGQTPDGNTRKAWYQRFGSEVLLNGVQDNTSGRIQAKVPTESVIGMAWNDGASLFDRAALAQKQQKKPKSSRRHLSNDLLLSRIDRGNQASSSSNNNKSPSTPRSSSAAAMNGNVSVLPFSLNDSTSNSTGNNTGSNSSGLSSSSASTSSSETLTIKLDNLELSTSNSNNGRSSPKVMTSGSGVLSPSKSSSGLSRQVSNVTVSLLDYYFPLHSVQRNFLEGLVYNVPLSPSTKTNSTNNTTNTSSDSSSNTNSSTTGTSSLTPTRWTAAEALAWLDSNWSTV